MGTKGESLAGNQRDVDFTSKQNGPGRLRHPTAPLRKEVMPPMSRPTTGQKGNKEQSPFTHTNLPQIDPNCFPSSNTPSEPNLDFVTFGLKTYPMYLFSFLVGNLL